AKVTVTEALYQPFAFGCRSGAAVVTGAVASYLSPYEAAPTFPALSKQEPLTLAEALSGPEAPSAAAVAGGRRNAAAEPPLDPAVHVGLAIRRRRRDRRGRVVLQRSGRGARVARLVPTIPTERRRLSVSPGV